MQHRHVSNDEPPATSPSAAAQTPGSRRNSQPFIRRQSVSCIAVPQPPDPKNDLFMRVKFDGTVHSCIGTPHLTSHIQSVDVLNS